MMFPHTEMAVPSPSLWGGITSPLQQVSELNPLAMVFTSCAHRIGASHFRWGLGKNGLVSPRDYVYMQWRWVDCCQ